MVSDIEGFFTIEMRRERERHWQIKARGRLCTRFNRKFALQAQSPCEGGAGARPCYWSIFKASRPMGIASGLALSFDPGRASRRRYLRLPRSGSGLRSCCSQTFGRNSMRWWRIRYEGASASPAASARQGPASLGAVGCCSRAFQVAAGLCQS